MKFICSFFIFIFIFISCSNAKKIILNDSVDFVTAVSTFQSANTPYASPACWLSGIEQIEDFVRKGSVLQQEYSSFLSYSGTSFCATMTEPIRKILAFHTTRCHCHSSKRKFASIEEVVDTKNENLHVFLQGEVRFEDENSGQSLDTISDSIDSILSKVSETNFMLYTSFVQHIDHICVELSQEMWNGQIERATHNLMKTVQDIPNEINTAVLAMEIHYNTISEKELIANQKRMDDQESLKKILTANSEKISSYHEQYQTRQEEFQSTIDKISIPINKIAEGMNELTPTNTVLQFLAVLNAMWLLTSFSWIAMGRPFIILVSCGELFIESFLHWFAMQGHIMVTFKELLIPKIRIVALGLDVLIIFLSMCYCFLKSKPVDDRYGMNNHYTKYYMNGMDNGYSPNHYVENVNTSSEGRRLRCYDDNVNLANHKSSSNMIQKDECIENLKSSSNMIQKDECIENLFNTFSNLQNRSEHKSENRLPFQSPHLRRTRSSAQQVNSNIPESGDNEKEDDEDSYVLNELVSAKTNLINLLEYVDTIEKIRLQEKIRSPKRSLVEDPDSEEEGDEVRGGKKIRLSID